MDKIINYCWFGRGEKPKLVKKCIASWKKFCPDYKIIEWNEDNFDIDKYPYARYCLDTKKYAFLSDFVRLQVVYENGGIYFDTDVEVIRNIDSLLDYEAFYAFENDSYVATGLGFGAQAKHPTIKAMVDKYHAFTPEADGSFKMIGCPKLNTEALLEFGLELNGKRQNVGGAEIFPAEFFNPYDDPTGRLNTTKNTYSIHWFAKSALSKSTILKSKLTRPIHRLFGTDFLKKPGGEKNGQG